MQVPEVPAAIVHHGTNPNPASAPTSTGALETRVLLRHAEDPKMATLPGYESYGGYATLKKVLREIDPEWIVSSSLPLPVSREAVTRYRSPSTSR